MVQRKLTTVAGIVLATLLCAAYVLGEGAETLRFDPARLETDYGMKIETKEKAVTVKVGDTLNAVVTNPGKVAAAGFSGTQEGKKLKLVWEGKNVWKVFPSDNKMRVGRINVVVSTLAFENDF